MTSARLIAWGMFVLVLPGFLAALLIGPRSPAHQQEKWCVYNLVSDGPFGLSLNCDAVALLSLARDPLKHLEPGNLRQSRPLMALPAALLRPLFLPLIDAPQRLALRPAPDLPEFPRRFMGDLFAHDFPGFVAFAVVNVLLLIACFAVYLRLVGEPSNLPAAIIVGSVGLWLVGNDIVKAFFWSPHAQLYNLLVPLMAMWAMSSPVGSWRRGVMVGLLSGIGTLAYPLFPIVPACYALRGLVEAAVDRRSAPCLAAVAAGIGLFVVPVAWLLFVLGYVGSFYSDSLAFNQGSWIIDSVRGGTFWSDLARPAGLLFWNLKKQLPPIAVMAAISLALFVVATPRILVARQDAQLFLSAIVVGTVAFAFYALAGLNAGRNVAAVLPPMVVSIGILGRLAADASPPAAAWLGSIAMLAVAYGQLVYTAIKAGPYS